MEKLTFSPLQYSIFKLEFARLPEKKLSGVIDDLLEELRGEYPDFTVGEVNAVTVDFSLGENSSPNVKKKEEKLPRWTFRNPQKTWEVDLTLGNLIVHTSDYELFDELKKRVLRFLEVVDEYVPIKFTKFAGLRYINRVDFDPDFPDFSQVNQGFLQPDIPRMKAKGGSSMLNIYQTPKDTWIRLNTSIKVGGYDIPDDLLQLASRVRTESEPRDDVFAVVDIDSINGQQDYVPFSLERVASEIDALHEGVEVAFESVINKKALEKWG